MRTPMSCEKGRSMRVGVLLLVLAATPALPARAQIDPSMARGPRVADLTSLASLEPLRFLAGSWSGEGSGAPGAGAGRFTFLMQLDGKALVRSSRTAYPATKDRAAAVHEDLMVVYLEPSDRSLAAAYFDNEGHVIRYRGEVAVDGSRVTFTSEAVAAAPRFRLTYTRAPNDTLAISFDIAEPGGHEFKTYVSGFAKRIALR